MLTVFTRRLALPARSFLLLGPRGTGKTTWLRQRLARAGITSSSIASCSA
jgi:predicted AAA+ superfamily ATPase